MRSRGSCRICVSRNRRTAVTVPMQREIPSSRAYLRTDRSSCGTMTHGANPEAGKEIIIERTEKLKLDSIGETQNPLLASKAAQSSIGTAALVSTML